MPIRKTPLHTGVRTGCHYSISTYVCLSVCLYMFSIRRFTDFESCTRPISTNPGSMEAGDYGITRGTCFVARCLEVVAVAGLLWISLCVLGAAGFRFFSLFFSERTRSAPSIKPPFLIYFYTGRSRTLPLVSTRYGHKKRKMNQCHVSRMKCLYWYITRITRMLHAIVYLVIVHARILALCLPGSRNGRIVRSRYPTLPIYDSRMRKTKKAGPVSAKRNHNELRADSMQVIGIRPLDQP